ncbi:UDP-N-acetylmuramoyl-tripeptide--D-alanyl-D-alanine ligase [Megasphaera cerevisiae DSM 20462]|jgi:UDP-N-acetylmuramoyl-tripeptide--D-alanyl-D-alanine ligase|uniref:UDP-N-acetylmuramoyl-tripeptide--D-alanyl-D-alanine ligase n=1 Tax=Megasphaera cerevisiae DSM 20462 TaxID=1122219 RepID=A0A0J6WR43_9FIRM|nr:UDP-N-acetylmuramoyl-tripeptide--D-alanyl-D-alanine ligase [Megasphaera cerevisiae]KMO85925.1 UDP-N-acetylmuramoyl-tripeptide--D-alanyl-D-alanine ligase [Megasphaera cerevisiae DSM 20462]MCI1750666.1 UDP-N-acetylmuramoyl-tripeptide--D-alanyl-D-alanine ligase [Megasphaera cerevisiae]OKY54450.1 UDP-N-acetylmuramoyl-tripeptide--D-alanyl-D-alanine ligase [Megasphaera cerevisiae]SKA08436.1 UDP-N-acetylmuramoyl-tripeptide--D-alanyl-D-alanine ligase [Megasphaera cerevisiae DSM 20462]
MAAFTIPEVERATEGRLLFSVSPGLNFSQVDTDTRTIEAGSLFVALKGENFDGHNFIRQAVEKGAAGVIVSEEREEYAQIPAAVFLVRDTRRAYQNLARFHRRRFAIPVIAVTGSVGKTSTRNMISTVLSQKFRVLQTEKNFNNEIGLPRTLLQLTSEYEACVVEMGMRGLGQIAELSAIAEPTIGVVTNVGKSHIELLGSQENIAKAKCELVQSLNENGIAVLNQDDPFVAAMADACKGKVVGYGIESNAPIRADRVVCNEKGIRFTCRCFDQMFEAHVAGIGEHNVYNSLAAVAVGRIVGLSEYQMQKGLAEYKGTAMRQELLRMGPYTFINDAYNANPASMTEAVRSLALLTKGRKLLVLGGMLELGDWTQQEHEKIGREIAEEGMDILITLGEPAGYIAAAARQSGMKNVYTVTTHEEAAQRLQSVIKPGDTVLVKGSRGFKMEKILPYFERK